MLEGSINNAEGHRDQYQVTNMKMFLEAVDLLEVTEIQVRDLQTYRIGHIVNKIRRKLGNENSNVKLRLKQLIVRWRDMAAANPDEVRNGNTNNTEAQPQRIPNGNQRAQADNEKELKSRLQPDARENGESNSKQRRRRERPPNKNCRPKTPIEPAKERPKTPLVEPATPKNGNSNSNGRPVVKIVPPVPEIAEISSQVPKAQSIDQSSNSQPVSNVASGIREENSQPTSHSKMSRKRPLDTAQIDVSKSIDKMPKVPSSPLFSSIERFVPSVSVDSSPQVPSTPNNSQIEKAANGDEWEGVSGVRDSKGNFHRWHDEIHLEPEGTEPFLHILPYVDIDLELL